MGGKSFKDILWKIFRFVFLGFMALISVGPLVWIVMSSFKSNLKDGEMIPHKVPNPGELQMELIRRVKIYERLASEAIRTRSISKAIDCLMVHPLVNSYSLAKKLVETYLATNKDYMEEWN